MKTIGPLFSLTIQSCPNCGIDVFEAEIQEFDKWGREKKYSLYFELDTVEGYMSMYQRMRDDLVAFDAHVIHKCKEETTNA